MNLAYGPNLRQRITNNLAQFPRQLLEREGLQKEYTLKRCRSRHTRCLEVACARKNDTALNDVVSDEGKEHTRC